MSIIIIIIVIISLQGLIGLQLYFSDPSGTYIQYKAKSIGAGSECVIIIDVIIINTIVFVIINYNHYHKVCSQPCKTSIGKK